MSIKTLRKSFVVALAFTSLSSFCWASGKANMSTETTQVLNNIELVMQVKEQIKSNLKQIEQYELQIEQFTRQVTDALNVPSFLSGMTLEGLTNEARVSLQARDAYTKLYGSVDELSREWQARLVEANSQGIPVQKYLENEADRIRKGNSLAIQRIEQEKRLMANVDEDFSLARQWGSQISRQSGINASIGLLNTQLNRVVQQNARMVQMMAQAQNSDKARKEQLEAERVAQTKTLLSKQHKNNAAGMNEMADSIKGIDSGKTTASPFSILK
ncbi:hypothetical protein LJR189_004711 [Acidovorax delafieldii]|uniref:hypothetical protein n=1 Tax=Acidovorax delafieldii TaxID=47920 RepID=UPI003ED02150